MIRTTLTLLAILYVSLAGAQIKGNDFLKMIGHRIDAPETQELLAIINKSQVKEEYQPLSATYSITSFSNGIALDFNKNLILKEIRFYDSGYLFKKCTFSLPLYHKMRIHRERFFERFTNYDEDAHNPFLYHGRFENGTVKVYFRARHAELITLTYNADALVRTDRESMVSWGYRVIPDGQCLTSPCSEGQNKMYWPNRKLTLESEFKYGVPHGIGSFSDTTGLSYSGGFKLGFLWGEGELTVPSQFEYEGKFLMGKRNGHGTTRFKNGTRYTGNWLNDKMHGSGTFWYSENYVYTGEFFQDEIKGKGKLTTPEGSIEGSFRKGRPHGFAEQYVQSSQTTLSGNWVDGKKEGEFTLKSPFYGLKKLYFKDGEEIAAPEN